MNKCITFIFIFLLSVMSINAKDNNKNINVLVYYNTAGYWHESTPEGVKTFVLLGNQNQWNVTSTEDSTLFTDAFLNRFDVIVFLETGLTIFDDMQKAAVQRFVRGGKGLITVHTGTYTEMEWPWWVNAVGGKFLGHPPEQKGKLIIEDNTHISTLHLTEPTWETTDEWYSFDRNPRDSAHVLISIDENSYNVDDDKWFPGVNQRMGDHPIVWYREYENGRIYQTALGHSEKMFQDPNYQKLLTGAILWAAGKE
ncbi:MAG: ThuA domain-containing protein [Bacteroidales bacterium]|nr:ThuA domain-containing protein [Bacteroidales bacterium]